MAAIFLKTISNAFSLMKIYEFQLKFHWSLFLRVQLTISQHGLAPSHCLNPYWLVYWYIYVSLGLDELTKNFVSIAHLRPASLEAKIGAMCFALDQGTVETLYSTIYYSKYFIELNFDKSTQYVALWTHKRHPIPRPFGRAMECLLWVLQQKLIVL